MPSSGQIHLPTGLVIGAGTAYRVEAVEGLDVAEVRDSDLAKISDHGYFAGQDLLERRTVRIRLGVIAPTAAQMPVLLHALRKALSPVASPTGISFRMPNDVDKFVYAMPRRSHWANDSMTNVGAYAAVTTEIVAPDPLIYGTTLYDADISAGSRFLANAGTWPTKPVLVVTGSATNPAVTLAGKTVRVNVSVPAGQTLTVDFPHRTVTLNGVNRYDALDPAADDWWELQPGSNILSANQASIETDATGWPERTGTTAARSTAQALDGGASLAVTASGAPGDNHWVGAPNLIGGAATLAYPVSGGQPYTLTEHWRAATTGRSVHAQINWYTSTGAAASTASHAGTAVTDSTTGWTAVTLTATAPSNAAYARIFGFILLPADGEVHYLDKISFGLGATAHSWAAGGAQNVTYAGGGTAKLQYRDTWA